MLIDLFRSDLVKGYRKIKQARRYLIRKWRFDLLRAYARKWERYAQVLARQEVRRMRFQNHILPWIAAGLLASGSAGLWLIVQDGSCYGSLLFLGAIVGGLTAVGLWFGFSVRPSPPPHPLEQRKQDGFVSPLKEELFPDLVTAWQEGLRVEVPSALDAERMAEEQEKWGLVGEYRLIRRLERILPPDTFILHSLMPKPNDDMDVVVIGPRGFWYFEVKHWNADIAWRNGAWDIRQYDHERGEKVRLEMREYPDAQWSRMRRETLAYLNSQAKGLLDSAPVLGRIKGGIVFTHPKATYNIQRPASFNWGTVLHWLKFYRSLPIYRVVTPDLTLQLTEALLERHQSFNPGRQLYSMDAYVRNVLQGVEGRLEGWIERE